MKQNNKKYYIFFSEVGRTYINKKKEIIPSRNNVNKKSSDQVGFVGVELVINSIFKFFLYQIDLITVVYPRN